MNDGGRKPKHQGAITGAFHQTVEKSETDT